MTIEHRNIVDPNQHEPKGAGSAAAGQVYVSDGAGSGAFQLPELQYGSINSVEGDAVSISTIGTTAKLLDAFTNNGPTNGITADQAAGTLTVGGAGDYFISFHVTFATAAAGDAGLYEFGVRADAVESALKVKVQMSGSSDTHTVSMSGILALADSDVLSIYVESDEAGGTDDINISNIHFQAIMVQPS